MNEIDQLHALWKHQRERLDRGEEVSAKELFHGTGCPCPLCVAAAEYWQRHRDYMEKAEQQFRELERRRNA